MSNSNGFRHRLLTIVLVGVVTSALSLGALVRILSLTTAQRLERGRDAVSEELERLLAAQPGGGDVLSNTPAMGMIGMRGGYWDPRRPSENLLLPARTAEVWRSALDEAVRTAHTAERPLGSATLLVVARPSKVSGTYAWVGYLVLPPTLLHIWRLVVILLTIATSLLVVLAVSAVLAFKRGAAALNHCLSSLGSDPSTPIPRPNIRELSEISDGIAQLSRDLAHSREMQERLGHELSARDRLAALGRVAAGVAHEVRNPLASIKLRLDLAAATTALPPAAEKAITHSIDEISRLDRLVADLLTVAGDKTGPRLEATVGGLVRARVEALLPWSSARGIAIRVEGDGKTAIDPESVARAIDNLLRNAVEASPAGAAVEVRVAERDGSVEVVVKDGGAGVAGERVAELFEPFFTTKSDGTGLGLAISRAIARAHGGDVTYARNGATTCFSLSLPRARSQRSFAGTGTNGNNGGHGAGNNGGTGSTPNWIGGGVRLAPSGTSGGGGVS